MYYLECVLKLRLLCTIMPWTCSVWICQGEQVEGRGGGVLGAGECAFVVHFDWERKSAHLFYAFV